MLCSLTLSPCPKERSALPARRPGHKPGTGSRPARAQPESPWRGLRPAEPCPMSSRVSAARCGSPRAAPHLSAGAAPLQAGPPPRPSEGLGAHIWATSLLLATVTCGSCFSHYCLKRVKSAWSVGRGAHCGRSAGGWLCAHGRPVPVMTLSRARPAPASPGTATGLAVRCGGVGSCAFP